MTTDDQRFAKGDRVISESFGFGTVLAEPESLYVTVVFDDDIAPSRNVLWWMLGKIAVV